MKDLVKKTRTFRRFQADRTMDTIELEYLIELARLSGSARNGQPWQYLIINTPELCAKVFPYLGWAGYLSDWKGPEEHERPVAYILCYLNNNWLKGSVKEAYFDLGISTQSLLLGAMDKGYGGCRIASFSPKLAELFSLKSHLELCLVVALGVPAETVVIEESKGDDITYWRDEHEIHHVPKRSLSEILLDPIG